MSQTHYRGRHWLALNQRQRLFVKLYLGSTAIHGNGTRCYMAAYETENVLAAQRSASRLLKNQDVQAIITAVETAALEQLQVDATFVLGESLRLYQRAMGDDSFETVEVDTDPETGCERVNVTSRRDYDPATAKAALQLIGQHRDVQAFTQTVEHNHTHHLEQRLAARSAVIEGRATQVIGSDDDKALAPAVEGPGMANVEVEVEQTPKRVHTAEVNDDQAPADEKTSSERAGATA